MIMKTNKFLYALIFIVIAFTFQIACANNLSPKCNNSISMAWKAQWPTMPQEIPVDLLLLKKQAVVLGHRSCFALDRKNGKLLWVLIVKGHPCGLREYSNQHLLLYTDRGEFYIINAKSGVYTVKSCNIDLPHIVIDAKSTSMGIVIYTNGNMQDNGHIYLWDIQSSAIKWKHIFSAHSKIVDAVAHRDYVIVLLEELNLKKKFSMTQCYIIDKASGKISNKIALSNISCTIQCVHDNHALVIGRRRQNAKISDCYDINITRGSCTRSQKYRGLEKSSICIDSSSIYGISKTDMVLVKRDTYSGRDIWKTSNLIVNRGYIYMDSETWLASSYVIANVSGHLVMIDKNTGKIIYDNQSSGFAGLGTTDMSSTLLVNGLRNPLPGIYLFKR